MNFFSLVSLLVIYGSFLIICGIISVIFIGRKAKTALISGSTTGVVSYLLAYLDYKHYSFAPIAGILLTLFLFGIFSWRATKTLFIVFDLIPTKEEGLQQKGIAFLIISLMAIISLMICVLQITFYS